MIPVLLILIPLLSGLFLFFLKEEKAVKNFALITALITLAVVVYAIAINPSGQLTYDAAWLPAIGSRFSLGIDGMGKMLILLTSISFPVVFISTSGNTYKNTAAFYALMLLTQCGLMGVFLATDALLFYFFWELALVPVYFLCSIWGGEKRIAVTFKFFIYTFVGSLLMLAGILFLHYKSEDGSFAIKALTSAHLDNFEQNFLFWLFFIAFAIKMPIFPLHTWQPDAYEQAPTAVTMILSGVMVKMGIFAVIRWLVPLFPLAAAGYANLVMILSITGMIYASLIAIKQDDIKRLIAYSSIAHIGLMCAAIFAHNQIGLEGVMIQMFNHGINVIGLWIVANAIEQQLHTRKFSELGGLAQTSPVLAILLVVMALANVALPLTNAFVGEFLMFNGIFQFNVWMAAVAGISIILAAVYTLNMIQKIFYGKTVAATEHAVDISSSVKWTLIFLVIVVLILGVYPQPLINLTKDTVNAIVANR
jgi:NADH-quinone oxidoreductase subunit M